MFPAVLSNSSPEEPSGLSSTLAGGIQDFGNSLNPMVHQFNSNQDPGKTKKKRNLPGNPDPDAEVIALSPKTLMATNRFVCEICNKGFQRDQNLQLHRRGHNLPWKLKQRSSKENKKRAYVCPEPTCVHHHPSRALGDLTGIKKHYCRKHGEKKWKCEKCSKIYAVQSDWKAHSKTCGTREYRCDCGTLFSRKDSFITHRAFCDALAEESARISAATHSLLSPNSGDNVANNHHQSSFLFQPQTPLPPPPAPPSFFPFASNSNCRHFSAAPWDQNPNPNNSQSPNQVHIKHEDGIHIPLSYPVMTSPYGNLHISPSLPPLSATALLQKAAAVSSAGHVNSTMAHLDMHMTPAWQKTTADSLTRDFLGLAGDQCGGSSGGGGGGAGGGGNGSVRDLLPYTPGGMEFPPYDRGHSFLKNQGFGFGESCQETWGSS
ncbi:protein indeterminate-domain 12-like [Andrographis paniculata]|uniref:protein indeterminate-domain 12-like n=1 Tax=Andrographis paniculata TaxID=175694 RepID=UPI0021E8E0EA|nr:protein indeterminate-domain 12-like [Andrographis paniculata]XP_051120755.1 protein indeterminate-domain 12-like [Andrographis paniculata]XP_051120756.1 protein indeterminate-domain 12-like [Andrographis paniculata]